MATTTRAHPHSSGHDRPIGRRVICDPRIQGGEPTVRGTRTTVRSIVLAAREAGTLGGVLYDFPHLRAEDVADALAYYEHHRDEIDALIGEFADGGA